MLDITMVDIIDTILDGLFITDDLKAVLCVVFYMFVVGSLLGIAKGFMRMGRL